MRNILEKQNWENTLIDQRLQYHILVWQILKQFFLDIIRNFWVKPLNQIKITKNCVLNGKCLSKGVVYKAEVMSTGMTASYIGIAANLFKERYTNHKLSFNNLKYEYNTSLSKHIWGLNKINEPFTISLSIVSKAKLYNPVAKRSNLCLMEKKLVYC